MRKLIFAINMSLDGYCNHDNPKFTPDAELMDYFTQLVGGAGAFVYGRITYELMVPYWPDMAKNPSGNKADDDYARAFDSVEKIVVFSKSLNSVEGKNTEIAHTSLQDTILKLKQEDGKDILTGGVNIPLQLIELGLVDEYRFVIYPVVAGEGRKLFEDFSSLKLKLIESRTFISGCVVLRYVKE